MGFGQGKGFTTKIKQNINTKVSTSVNGTTTTQSTTGKLTSSKTLVVS